MAHVQALIASEYYDYSLNVSHERPMHVAILGYHPSIYATLHL